MAYRACLAEADAPARFFHASFALDPINVSRTLLEWRATLYEFGWEGGFPPDAPARLRDLSDVEALASTRVPLCRGQRVRRITATLHDLATQIECVELLDDIHELPPVWRALLQKLGFVAQAAIVPTPRARAGTDLRVLQDALSQLAAAEDGARVAKRSCAATARSWCCEVRRATSPRRRSRRASSAQARTTTRWWTRHRSGGRTRRHHSRQRVRTRRTAARRLPALLALSGGHTGSEARAFVVVAAGESAPAAAVPDPPDRSAAATRARRTRERRGRAAWTRWRQMA